MHPAAGFDSEQGGGAHDAVDKRCGTCVVYTGLRPTSQDRYQLGLPGPYRMATSSLVMARRRLVK